MSMVRGSAAIHRGYKGSLYSRKPFGPLLDLTEGSIVCSLLKLTGSYNLT